MAHHMGELIFSCATTGRSINSGFQTTRDEFRLIPVGKKLRLRCRICGEVHKFDFAAATGLCVSSNFCRERRDCQHCSFMRLLPVGELVGSAISGIGGIAEIPGLGSKRRT